MPTNLISLIEKSAPTIATLLEGPLAGTAIGWIASLFGANSNDTQDIINKITLDPEAELKLKQLEFEHQTNILKIDSDNYKTEVDDRKNARGREVNLHDHIPTILAVGFLTIYALVQVYCVTHSTSANDIISARLQDVVIMIVSYYFGSSHREKPTQP